MSSITYLNISDDSFDDNGLTNVWKDFFINDALDYDISNENIFNSDICYSDGYTYRTTSSDIGNHVTDLKNAITNAKSEGTKFKTENSNNNNSFMNNTKNRLLQLSNQKQHIDIINHIIDGSDIEVDGKGEEDIINDQIEKINKENEEIKKKEEIYEYYVKKRTHQINIFKNMTYMLLVLLIFAFLFKMNIISESIFASLIGIGIAILVIYLGYETMDMMFRNNIDYDEYDNTQSDIYLRKHNKNNASRLDIPLQLQKDIVEDVSGCENNNVSTLGDFFTFF